MHDLICVDKIILFLLYVHKYDYSLNGEFFFVKSVEQVGVVILLYLGRGLNL